MKRGIAIALCAGLTGVTASGQQAGAPETRVLEWTSQAGGLSTVAVETRTTRGQPYSGDAVTEFVQTLADGNRIVRRTSTRLYRDSEGRTRRETNTEAGGVVRSSIVITDPADGSSFILDPQNHTATRAGAMVAATGPAGAVTFSRSGGGEVAVATGRGAGGAGGRVAITREALDQNKEALDRAKLEVAAKMAEAGTRIAVEGGSIRMMRQNENATTEDLGEQMVEGVMAKGTRTTTVVPAGAIGNEQPITTTSEQWFSTELQMLVLTKHSDPRVGETTYRLTNISRTEPDKTLFQVPPDYTLREMTFRRPQQ